MLFFAKVTPLGVLLSIAIGKPKRQKIGRRPSISTVIKSLPDTHKNRFTVEPLTDQCRIYIKNNKKLFVQVGYKRQ